MPDSSRSAQDSVTEHETAEGERLQEECLATRVALTHSVVATHAADRRLTALDREHAAERGVADVQSALALPVWHSRRIQGMVP